MDMTQMYVWCRMLVSRVDLNWYPIWNRSEKRSYLWCVIDNHCSASRGGSLLWDLQVQLSLLVKHDWFYCQWNTQRFVVLCKNIEKRIGKRKRYLGVPCNHKVHSAWDQDPMFQKSSEHGRNHHLGWTSVLGQIVVSSGFSAWDQALVHRESRWVRSGGMWALGW